jgi:hypothetical protein
VPNWIVTGADAAHFVNLRLLVASWWEQNRQIPFVFCDYGLSREQRAEVAAWPVTVLPRPVAFEGKPAWRAKAGLYRYLQNADLDWDVVVWIDADAMFLRPLPDLEKLTAGYDLLIDAHTQSVGEIVEPANLSTLLLEPADAYFSSGFWVVRNPGLLATWDKLVDRVMNQGNLWENDAFVAAIYETRARIRTVCGNIWHVRGATSIDLVTQEDNRLCYAGQPAYVLHANWKYTLREDHRRVFVRPLLREV